MSWLLWPLVTHTGRCIWFFLSQKMFRSPTNYGQMWHFYKGKLVNILSKYYCGSNFSQICKLYALFTRCYTMYVGCSLGHFQGLLICLFGHKRSSGHMAKCLIIWLREYERWVSRNRETKSHIWRVLVHCLKTIICTILYG